jgi:hypothetical protein
LELEALDAEADGAASAGRRMKASKLDCLFFTSLGIFSSSSQKLFFLKKHNGGLNLFKFYKIFYKWIFYNRTCLFVKIKTSLNRFSCDKQTKKNRKSEIYSFF